MAKVQIKLDQRKNCRKTDGSYPLVLSISHNSKSRTISLKYSFPLEKWDDKKLKPINIPNHKQIGAKLHSQLSKAQLFINQNHLEIKNMRISKLKLLVEAEIFSNFKTTDKVKQNFIVTKESNALLTEFARIKINRLRISKKFGNATAIETGLNAICKFKNVNDIQFSNIDVDFLKDFCAFSYSKGNKPNTISAYLRPIKTLFNEAVSEGIIPTALNPFLKFKIPTSKKTKNRALRMEEINRIRKLNLKINSSLWNARNYFLFMFNNMGLNFIDLVKLKKEQISNSKYDKENKLIEGRINYDRSKTSSSFSVKLTEESIQILNHQNVGDLQKDDFVFPFKYEESEIGRRRYMQQRKRLNRKIKEFAKMAGINEDVTTYFARHSWATIAKRKMIPISVISEGLGHKNLKTTQIYLDSFDNDELDNANDQIVS